MERLCAENPVVTVSWMPRIAVKGAIPFCLELQPAEEAPALAGECIETKGSDSRIRSRHLGHSAGLRPLLLNFRQVLLCSFLACGGAERDGRRLDGIASVHDEFGLVIVLDLERRILALLGGAAARPEEIVPSNHVVIPLDVLRR